MRTPSHANLARQPRLDSTPRQHAFSRGAFSALVPQLQRAVAAARYTTPTPIQEQCIPHLLARRDLLGCAQTGTGKTAAFVLPLLQRLHGNSQRPRRNRPRALILTPTRELAAQVAESVQNYGRFLRLSHTVIFGGVNQRRQVMAMNRGVDILVATPGRLLDLMRQGFVHLNEVELFVLDEADRMLDMGFLPDIKQVLAQLPSRRQTLFFSATMTPKVVELARSMVCEPVHVTIEPDKPAVERIAQKVFFVGKRDKDALLLEVLSDPQVSRAIVFTQMKHAANQVVEKLSAVGIRGVAIHGNKSQAARTRALDGFRHGRFRVLVATDVAARGLDVDGITHVINYDLPLEAETYVHRIGRTARASADGDALSFCCAEDRSYLAAIERLLGTAVPVEAEHDYHCEEAQYSRLAAPKQFGRQAKGGSRRNQRGPSGQRRQNTRRSRRQRV